MLQQYKHCCQFGNRADYFKSTKGFYIVALTINLNMEYYKQRFIKRTRVYVKPLLTNTNEKSVRSNQLFQQNMFDIIWQSADWAACVWL